MYRSSIIISVAVTLLFCTGRAGFAQFFGGSACDPCGAVECVPEPMPQPCYEANHCGANNLGQRLGNGGLIGCAPETVACMIPGHRHPAGQPCLEAVGLGQRIGHGDGLSGVRMVPGPGSLPIPQGGFAAALFTPRNYPQAPAAPQGERIVYVPYACPPPIAVERLKSMPVFRPPFIRRVLGDAYMYEYPEMPLQLYTTRGPRDFMAPHPPSIGE